MSISKWQREPVWHRHSTTRLDGTNVVTQVVAWRIVNLCEEYLLSHCIDCNEFNPIMFMVHDELWILATAAGERKRRLCWTCFEKRIKRPLQREDLTMCLANQANRRVQKLLRHQ